MEHPQPLDQKAVDSSLAQLEQLAEGVVQTLEQLESASNSLERGGDAAIHAKVESLMSSFEEMHEMELPPQLTAPFGALDHIDKGENPDRYWKHVAETTVQVRVHTPLNLSGPRRRGPSSPHRLPYSPPSHALTRSPPRRASRKTRAAPRRCTAFAKRSAPSLQKSLRPTAQGARLAGRAAGPLHEGWPQSRWP